MLVAQSIYYAVGHTNKYVQPVASSVVESGLGEGHTQRALNIVCVKKWWRTLGEKKARMHSQNDRNGDEVERLCLS